MYLAFLLIAGSMICAMEPGNAMIKKRKIAHVYSEPTSIDLFQDDQASAQARKKILHKIQCAQRLYQKKQYLKDIKIPIKKTYGIQEEINNLIKPILPYKEKLTLYLEGKSNINSSDAELLYHLKEGNFPKNDRLAISYLQFNKDKVKKKSIQTS